MDEENKKDHGRIITELSTGTTDRCVQVERKTNLVDRGTQLGRQTQSWDCIRSKSAYRPNHTKVVSQIELKASHIFQANRKN